MMDTTMPKTTIQDIFSELEGSQTVYLTEKLAIAYIFSALLEKGEVYGTQLIADLETHPKLRVSDTILYAALTWMKNEKAVSYEDKKIENGGRGRPRRMYRLREEWRPQAEKLAELWRSHSQA